MEKSNFDNLLEKYVKSQVSEEEKIKIEAWLDSVKTNNRKASVWRKEDEEELFKKITSNIDNVQEIISYQPQKTSQPNTIQWLAAAATLLLLITISLIAWRTVGSKATSETIAVNDIEKLILEDGTIVWLKEKSRLLYSENKEKSERRVTLTGEGLFEVAKDASRPFIIDCGEVKVRVLGTSFNLKTDHNITELKVLTGHVNVSFTSKNKEYDVLPNEKIRIARDATVETQPLEDAEISRLTAYTEYNMIFENSSLQEVFSRIEKKFDVKIEVASGDFSKCRVTTDLSDQSLGLSLQNLNELVNLSYKIDNNSVVISGRGCN